jgi:hypothetical protein
LTPVPDDAGGGAEPKFKTNIKDKDNNTLYIYRDGDARGFLAASRNGKRVSAKDLLSSGPDGVIVTGGGTRYNFWTYYPQDEDKPDADKPKFKVDKNSGVYRMMKNGGNLYDKARKNKYDPVAGTPATPAGSGKPAKRSRFEKGSEEAKAHMAALRAQRGKKARIV